MSAVGTPYDKAKAEGFFKTLKTEEVYLTDDHTCAEAETNISQGIADVYNRKRLRSSLGGVRPAAFEAGLTRPEVD